jgi:O-antigen/teichoic acid export membrane protein
MFAKYKSKLTVFNNGNTVKSFHIGFSQGLVALLFIATDFIFSKKLTVYEFGYWKELFFILNLGIPLLSFGLPEGFKYFIAKDKNKIQVYFSNIFGITLAIAGVLFFVLLAFNYLHYIGFLDLGMYYEVSLLFPLPFIAFLTNKVFRYLFINLDLSKKLTTLSVYASIISVIVLLTAMWGVDYFDVNFLFWSIAIYTVIFLSTVLFYFRYAPFSFKVSKIQIAPLKEMFKYGLPLYLANFMGIITLNIDKLIVTSFESKEVFAIFAVGAFEVPIFVMLSAAFSQQIFPKMVQLIGEDKEQQAKDLWIATTKQISLLSYPLILLAMIFAEDILFFIYSSDYGDSVFLFKTYLLVALFRNNSYGILLTTKNKNKFITYFAIFTLILNLIFSILFYYFFGIMGVIYGTLLSAFCYTVLVLVKENLQKEFILKFLMNRYVLILLTLILTFYFF